MRAIDIHAHIVPGKIAELRNGGDWHGFTFTEDSGQPFLIRDSRRYGLHPKHKTKSALHPEIINKEVKRWQHRTGRA